MLKLYNIFESLILEGVNRDAIIDAINNKYRVNITYSDDDNMATGKRYIEPYVYGTTSKGHKVIRAYQIFGDTKTVKPAWKEFRVDRITSWEPTSMKFWKSIDNYGDAPRYNPNDNGMVSIDASVKF
jgi:predicted DNA-binding transcriptional regulator YafY